MVDLINLFWIKTPHELEKLPFKYWSWNKWWKVSLLLKLSDDKQNLFSWFWNL